MKRSILAVAIAALLLGGCITTPQSPGYPHLDDFNFEGFHIAPDGQFYALLQGTHQQVNAMYDRMCQVNCCDNVKSFAARGPNVIVYEDSEGLQRELAKFPQAQ